MDEDETSSLLPRQSCENSRSWRTRCSLSCRYSLALTACLGFCVVFSLRVNLSVALVAMVNTTDTHRVHSLQNFGCTDEGLCNVSFTDTAQKVSISNHTVKYSDVLISWLGLDSNHFKILIRVLKA